MTTYTLDRSTVFARFFPVLTMLTVLFAFLYSPLYALGGLVGGVVLMPVIWAVFARARVEWHPGDRLVVHRMMRGPQHLSQIVRVDGPTIDHGVKLTDVDGTVARPLAGLTREDGTSFEQDVIDRFVASGVADAPEKLRKMALE